MLGQGWLGANFMSDTHPWRFLRPSVAETPAQLRDEAVDDRMSERIIEQVLELRFAETRQRVTAVVHEIEIRERRDFPAVASLQRKQADREVVAREHSRRRCQMAITGRDNKEAIFVRANSGPLHGEVELMRSGH